MKKILAFLCALTICFVVLPDSVAAWELVDEYYFYYSYEGNDPADITITEITLEGFRYQDNFVASGDIILPSSLYGDPVIRIADSAFCDVLEVTGFIIPDGVISIGDSAFQNCSSLSSITIPDSVTSIGACAFQNCSSLSSVAIPDSVTSIKDGTFQNCSSLSSVTIPDSVTSIAQNAFCKCSSLSSVTIPDSVTSIAQAAFRECSSLSSVTIPDSVTSIGNAAFYGCSSLSSVTIPDSVTSIAQNAFCKCSSLSSVTIPDSVTSIEGAAFSYCSSLSSVTIPDSVTSIELSAFFKCSSLNSITIPNGVTSIADKAFYDCTELKEIFFEGDAPSIGEYTFEFVTAKAYYPANNPTWTEEVMLDYGGTITWVPYEVKENAVEEWNVSLEDDLRVNFHLDGDIAQTAEVTVTVGDSVKTCSLSELEKDEIGRYIVSVNVAAAQMNDTITVKVTDMKSAEYTVRQYCDTVLGDESYSQYHQLVKEMLNYGAMAQLYFDHNTENLANDGITGVAAQEVPETAEEMLLNGEIDGVTFYGASLVYRDKIAVRYYFTVKGDAADYNFHVNGNAYTPVLKDGRYYIEVADILPQDLEQQIVLTVTDSTGYTLTVSYGPMNYIVRMNQKGNENTRNLLKALYNYHLAAKALHSKTE